MNECKPLDIGFLDLDTAPHYGLGLSETRTGRAVALHGGGRPVRLWTKAGAYTRSLQGST